MDIGESLKNSRTRDHILHNDNYHKNKGFEDMREEKLANSVLVQEDDNDERDNYIVYQQNNMRDSLEVSYYPHKKRRSYLEEEIKQVIEDNTRPYSPPFVFNTQGLG